MNSYRKNVKSIALLLFPALAVYLFFLIVPVAMTIFFSFHQWPGIQSVPLKYVGLSNYKALFYDDLFRKSLVNVLVYVFWSLLSQIPIGFALGFAIHKVTKGVKFFKAAFVIPMIISISAVSLLWNFIYFPADQGVLNQFLNFLGLPELKRNWLMDPVTSLGSVIVVSTWTSIGYYMIICLSAMSALPKSTLEAAEIDGAVGFRKIRSIVLPMIWGSVQVSIILVVTGVLKIFDTVYILTPNGGVNGSTIVPALLMYNNAFRYNDYGSGSAIATVIFVLSILISAISLRLTRREKAAEF
ncbi:carbohydrate ABC transporter permease [Cohnella cellulosilytica]